MPVSVTKSKKDEQTLLQMLHSAFPDKEVVKIEELTEGFFNVAYNITLSDGSEAILKIAPSPDKDIMTHEINIMFSEVDSMRRIAKETGVPAAEILYYDNSHTICDSDYFLMEKLRGKDFWNSMKEMTDEQKNKIFYQVGKYNAIINNIKNSRFGYYGQPDRMTDNWYHFFYSMILDTYQDAERKNIEIKVPKEKLLGMLEADRAIFEQVREPKLVHWDLWAVMYLLMRVRLQA
jgi:fructosamine-3-kinase